MWSDKEISGQMVGYLLSTDGIYLIRCVFYQARWKKTSNKMEYLSNGGISFG